MKNCLRFFISKRGNWDFLLLPVITICKIRYLLPQAFFVLWKRVHTIWTWTVNYEPRIKQRYSSFEREKKKYKESSRHLNNSLLLSQSVLAPSFSLLISKYWNNTCEILRWWCYAKSDVTHNITDLVIITWFLTCDEHEQKLGAVVCWIVTRYMTYIALVWG